MRLLIGIAVLALAVAPASANYLTNGGFENGQTGWTGTNWTLNADQYNPSPATLDGVNKAGDSNCNARNSQVYQTVAVPIGLPLTLTGGLAGGDAGGYTYYVKLLDGGLGGSVLGQLVLSGVNNWNMVNLQGVSTTGQVTVEFGSTGNGTWGPAGYHVDALDLTPEPVSLVMFGLAALPLLRRRR